MSRSFKAAIGAIGIALAWVGVSLVLGERFYATGAFIPVTFVAALGIAALIAYACVHEFRRLGDLHSWRRAATAIPVIALAAIFLVVAWFTFMWGAFYGPAWVSVVFKG